MAGRPVALLDRDGVLVRNLDGYVRDERDVVVLDGGRRGLELLARAGVQVAVVTNQACVGKGLLDERRVLEVHDHVLASLGPAARCVVATYVCPHRADDGCPCRKPAPGMVHAALHDLGAGPDDAFLVGDAPGDVHAALAAGVRAHLVRTGRATPDDVRALAPVARVAADLEAVVRHELARRDGRVTVDA
ncbi:D,D-heptose 1,7-bisphosphate phosphatase [Cellulomonas chitinilytica]|uniref:D,D-heptose 1,7-bisphosphate phosphatase n=1 Tax=Cellulomonas chitinilytica TaxID=398759 RepID=A0A919P2S1_9CELL|nr:HAD-IIIA family hydrolase [Cellulomonas chitinilytica]GIG20596.1 D,D-heptose 1,7-bisphosphate phosphatase [Cellulomonas chitinilytica]